MVQTLDQFTFVHEALAEVVLSGETNIKTSYLARYINSLQSSFTTEGSSVPFQLMDRQYSHVTSYRPAESELSAAILPANQLKNQSFDFIPLDGNRVCLSPVSGVEGSDYINASWLPGYRNLNEFILTQHPKESTREDFWRMVWEQKIQTAVILSTIQDPDYPVFWASQQTRLGNIILSPTEEGLLSGFQTKDFSLRLHNETRSMKVRLIFCPDWGNEDSYMMLGLVGVVNSLPPSPILVMDGQGGYQAGILVALSSLIQEAATDGYVDVYKTAKTLHKCRPGVWKGSDTLLALYKLTLSYCSKLDGRGNPDGSEEKQVSKF